MIRFTQKGILILFASICFLVPAVVGAQGLDTAKLDQILERSGQKMGDVYRVGFPRTDLHVTLHGVAIKPGLALGTWAAFAGTDDDAMVMGDIVLLPNEVSGVMSKLRQRGIEITALHNHLLGETPHVMYIHYMGHGKAGELAESFKAALAESKTPMAKPAAPEATAEPAFVKAVQGTLAQTGKFNGGVLAFGVPRAEPITMTPGGMTMPPSLGVAQSINFQEAGTGKVATTGDFVLIAEEVNPVISALEEHHIEVTGLHSHMLTEQPRLFFMHFWGYGPTQEVAEGIKAALDKIHTK
jgi:Domain of Unknown Function (DUF1259)